MKLQVEKLEILETLFFICSFNKNKNAVHIKAGFGSSIVM